MDIFQEMDWDLLRQQKQWLVCKSIEGSQNAAGLVILLDNLQDQAVRQGADPLVVFGTLD
jgi:hypothetical protein